MHYCKKCTMPDTRPGITFDEHGVCSACNHYENRKNIDWNARFKEFEKFCDNYRNCNGKGQYDCAVAVSGGKDSHFQVHMLKEVMHMHPILFTVEDNLGGDPQLAQSQRGIWMHADFLQTEHQGAEGADAIFFSRNTDRPLGIWIA